ncbi:MAG: hypothetical protein ACOX66_04890 [Oscillospiraceae bacterium]|jgi:ABC-2 type transport system permease protein
MKSKTSSFNKTLFFGLWKRFWPLFTAYLAIWVLLMPVDLGHRLSMAVLNANAGFSTVQEGPGMQYTTSLAADFGDQVLRVAISGGTIMSLFFCVLFAMAAYSYLYNPRSVSAICALPMRRQDVFRTQMLSGISLMLLINVAVALIMLAVGSIYGAKAGFEAVYVFQWLGIVCLQNLFFYGFATMCASFTGNIFVLPLVYFVLNFAVWGFAAMIDAVMSYFTYGYCSNGFPAADWFSPAIVLVRPSYAELSRQISETSTLITGYAYQDWGMLAIYAIVGLAFACFATLIIKRRRMESAGDVVALRPLKPAFKYCMTAGGALVLGLILFSTINGNGAPTESSTRAMLAMSFYMMLGGFIGYFASEMMMQKTLRVFTGKWKGFGVSCAVIVALLLCLRFDAFGVASYVPDASEVQGVSVDVASPGTTFEESENISTAIKLHKNIISHQAINNAAYTRDGTRFSVRYLYTLKNGKAVDRHYTLFAAAQTSDITDLNELINTQEAVRARKMLSVPVNISTILNGQINYFDKETNQYEHIALSSDEMYKLYTECIVPDTDERKLGKIWLIPDEGYNTRVLDCVIRFEVQQMVPGKQNRYTGDHFETTLTLDAARTYDWIQSRYHLPLVTMGESESIQKSDDTVGKPFYAKDLPATYSETVG